MSDPDKTRQGESPTTEPARDSWALSGSALWGRTSVVFLIALAFFAFLYAPSPLIYDSDSYFHLAVAREYAESGVSRQLEAVRFGLLAEQFGDKEFLFHAFLIPFVEWMEPTLGGRVALTLLGAAILTVVGYLSLRAIGGWGMLVPFWLCVGSLEFIWRLVRLRAELFSVLILLLALWAAIQKRYLLLALLSMLFALAYTAVHALVGLFLIILLAHAWAFKRWEWRLLVYPLLGAGVGLLIHPQFPDNLAVWWFQSIEYFRFKGALDVGTEIEPMRTDVLLITNFGWFLGMYILWRAAEKSSPTRRGEAALTFGVATLVFGLLYLMMSRFAVYFVPLATLWLLFEIRRQGRDLSRWVRLPWQGRIRLGLAWILCLLVCLPIAGYELRRYRHRNSPGPANERLLDREAFGETVADGARVVAAWRSTPLYMFWAPQGRYINVLDPVFLAAVDPAAHQAQVDIFAGREPDVPLVAATVLESQYIAYARATTSKILSRRLSADPRATLRYQDINVLFEFRAPETNPFVLDWKVIPSGSQLPPPEDEDPSGWPVLPRFPDPALRGLEGYVNARQVVGSEGCLGLLNTIDLESDTQVTYEFAPSGPSVLWVDGTRLFQIQKPQQAVLGEGTLFSLDLAAGEHRLSVLTCSDPETQYTGFYLVERKEH